MHQNDKQLYDKPLERRWLKVFVLLLFNFVFFINTTASIIYDEHFTSDIVIKHIDAIVHTQDLEHVFAHDHDHEKNIAHTHPICSNHSHTYCFKCLIDEIEYFNPRLNSIKRINEYYPQDLISKHLNTIMLRPPII